MKNAFEINEIMENASVNGLWGYVKAAEDGRADFNDGASLADCPYPAQSVRSQIWAQAWIEQKGYIAGLNRSRYGLKV